MLAKTIYFSIGLFIGCYFNPRIIKVETPQIHLIESRNSPPINVICPNIKCDNSNLKENILQMFNLAKQLSDKLSICYEERENYNNALKSEKEESAYWRKKYIDFSCTE